MYYNPTKVIASIGGASTILNPPSIQPTPPEFKPNGGDLVLGDFWYDPEEQILYVWISPGENQQPEWVPVGGDGFCPSACETSQETCLLEIDGGNASSKYDNCNW